MKKVIIALPTLVEMLKKTRKPKIKKSKIMLPKKGGPYNRAKNKRTLLKNS